MNDREKIFNIDYVHKYNNYICKCASIDRFDLISNVKSKYICLDVGCRYIYEQLEPSKYIKLIDCLYNLHGESILDRLDIHPLKDRNNNYKYLDKDVVEYLRNMDPSSKLRQYSTFRCIK